MRRTFSLISEFIWNISISCTESSWQWVGTWKTYFQCVLVKDLISPASLHMLVAWRMWTLTQVFQGGGGGREREPQTQHSLFCIPLHPTQKEGEKKSDCLLLSRDPSWNHRNHPVLVIVVVSVWKPHQNQRNEKYVHLSHCTLLIPCETESTGSSPWFSLVGQWLTWY